MFPDAFYFRSCFGKMKLFRIQVHSFRIFPEPISVFQTDSILSSETMRRKDESAGSRLPLEQ